MFLVFLFIPVVSFAFPNLTSESDNYFSYANTSTLSSSSLYLANNDDTSSGSDMRTISQGRYIGGGVAGTILGFGIGHAVQGRWMEKGWIYTALQPVTLVTSTFLWGLFAVEVGYHSFNSLTLIGAATLTLIFVGSKIWEIVDVWRLPDSIRMISSSQQMGVPSLYSYEYKSSVPGIGLQWQF